MEINHKSYSIVKELEDSDASHNWLVTDGEGEYICKQPWLPGTELEHYRRLKMSGIPVPQVLAMDPDSQCLLVQQIQGENVFDLVLQGQTPASLMDQIEEIARTAQEAGFNLDYFPANFACQDGKLYYTDYDMAPYMEEYSFENWGSQYWSRTAALDLYLQEYGAEWEE